MTKLTSVEADKLDNTCGNLRITKLGTHIKALEDFVNESALNTQANTVVGAINELYGMIVNNDCATIQIPPPGFFTLFGNDADGKLYVYYNDEDHPPVFQHIEDEDDPLNGTLYLYIADPVGENHYQLEIGHYIAVSHLNDYYTKTEIQSGYAIKNHAVNANTYGLGTTGLYGHVKTVNDLNTSAHADGLALSAYQGKVLKTSVDEKVVTVEKQSSAESGYAATYVVKQNSTQVGVKINIPKDFLVKSGTVETCSTADTPVQGYSVGDKYLDFVVNTVDSSESAQHIYILVKDLVDVYTADNSTLQLSGGQFSVKDGGITLTKLATAVQNTISGKEDSSNKVTSLSAQSTHTQYPSAKCVYDMIGTLSNYVTS